MSNLNELIEIYKDNGIELSDKTIREAFGESLRKLREHTNTTQKELAIETNVSMQSISVYERGEITPTITNGFRIATYFNLSVDDFIIYGLNAQHIFDENFASITDKYDFEQL